MPKKTKSTEVKTAKKPTTKPTTTRKKNVTEVKQNEIVVGNYSTTVYQNGEKLSFDIDWDRLREYMRTI